MNLNIKTFLSAFYQTNKREFWLLIISNIALGFILNYYDLNGLVETAIIVIMAMKNLSFLRSASIMPSVSSDFDRYSWKYFQGLPLNKEELIISLMVSNIFVMFPGLVWLMSFFIQIAGLFSDKRNPVDYILQLKIFLCLIPILLIISSMSLINLITFPRKQFSKNESKAVFLYKIKIASLGATGILYFSLACVYFNEFTGIEIALYVGDVLKFIYKQSNWWFIPALILAAVANYYHSIKIWQDEKRSYLKLEWNPKRDLSVISLCVALVWIPVKQLDLTTPEEFVDGKIVNAIYKDEFKIVEKLVEARHDINEVNSYGYSPIMAAAYKGNSKIFKFLEKKGARLTGTTKLRKDTLDSGLTIFSAAVKSGNVYLVEYLAKKNFDLNEYNKVNNWHPIHYASNHCKPKMVDLLIEMKADLNVKDKMGRTPLHLAAKAGCFASVALLLDAGADTTIIDKESKLASTYAERNSGKDKELAFYIEKRSRMPASK